MLTLMLLTVFLIGTAFGATLALFTCRAALRKVARNGYQG